MMDILGNFSFDHGVPSSRLRRRHFLCTNSDDKETVLPSDKSRPPAPFLTGQGCLGLLTLGGTLFRQSFFEVVLLKSRIIHARIFCHRARFTPVLQIV